MSRTCIVFLPLAVTVALVAFAHDCQAADNSAVSPDHVRVGLASLRRPQNVDSGVETIAKTLLECARQGVDIVCFPETYLPGLRGADKNLPPVDQPAMERAVERIAAACRESKVAAIVGVEWKTDRGLENRAVVFDRQGRVVGHQTKNQITPGGESENYVPDGSRRMFDVDGVRFGISICHEGWRYPETVRWAAVRGAQVVFQPQVTGSDSQDPAAPAKWGESFYEKAMQCRAEENSVYFVSVNRAMRRQNSASSVIDPKGDLVDFVPRSEEKLLVVDLDLQKATGFYASRFQPRLYKTRADQPGRQPARPNPKLPAPGDVTEIIMVEHRSLASPAEIEVLHLRKGDDALLERLAETLIKRGFFDLKEEYGTVFPDANSVQITVALGKEKKSVRRYSSDKFDDAWEFEMLIRGVAAQVSEEPQN